jgi:UDPglucose 6-dehydrogenase
MSKIAIIGMGVVGNAHKKVFPDAVCYDKFKKIGNKKEVNICDAACVCVWTPMAKNGHCNWAAVKEVVEWVECPLIIIRSTVPPGTTDFLKSAFKKRIVFQPEYVGESPNHPFADIKNQPFMLLGGDPQDINEAVKIWQTVINATVRIYQADARTVELAKLMENAFIGTKVTFCQEMYNIAKKLGVDYNVLRELWLADPRVLPWYTFVYENKRGCGGKCLPKDISSLAYEGKSEFFRFILKYNDKIRKG